MVEVQVQHLSLDAVLFWLKYVKYFGISNILRIFASKLISMRRLRYKFQSLGKKLPKTEDLNVYTYLDKRGPDGKLEWAQVGVLEKLETKEGVQIV